MSRRSNARLLAALCFTLLLVSSAAAPVRAEGWNPIDPGPQTWMAFLELVADWMGMTKDTPTPPPTGGGGGGGGNLGCPASNPNCGDSGGGADPFGRP